jgi:hypothetical protein
VVLEDPSWLSRFAHAATQASVDLLKKRGSSPVFKETPGGHNCLNEFVPQLYQ